MSVEERRQKMKYSTVNPSGRPVSVECSGCDPQHPGVAPYKMKGESEEDYIQRSRDWWAVEGPKMYR